jgi:histidine triad (HIT) family protein
MTQSILPDGCPLCGIAQGRLPAHIVYEEPRFLAVLDANPIRPGHVRIIPRAHYPCFNALPGDLAAALLDLGQRLGEAQRAVFKVDRVGFLFPAPSPASVPAPGQPPAHAHTHAVPLLSAGDIIGRRGDAGTAVAFDGPQSLAGRELAATAAGLRRALAQGRPARLAG